MTVSDVITAALAIKATVWSELGSTPLKSRDMGAGCFRMRRRVQSVAVESSHTA